MSVLSHCEWELLTFTLAYSELIEVSPHTTWRKSVFTGTLKRVKPAPWVESLLCPETDKLPLQQTFSHKPGETQRTKY